MPLDLCVCIYTKIHTWAAPQTAREAATRAEKEMSFILVRGGEKRDGCLCSYIGEGRKEERE